MRGILIIAAALVLAGATGAWAGTFRFDLTSYAGTDFNNFPEAPVDLGIQFSDISSAQFFLSGKFTPGKLRGRRLLFRWTI